ncbi:hypothetical protein M0D45_00825 [Xanthomonas prunicola]|uniref:hypothetical protein n=1 Tax=Xanthomonas prunicola TaxID=2053930 RepID=UPI0021B29593|nr:hypothetical protein [Xanthomonas prunicola]UXA53384.1 hypothetical protein M0D45_00825 [Xanthomonas prunicola]
MNWIATLGTACLGVAGLLLPLAMNKPRVCIRVAEFFQPLCLGAAFAGASALLGFVTARAIVAGAIQQHRAALAVGGEKAVEAVRTSLDSGLPIWGGYAFAPMVLYGIMLAASRLSEMILSDAAQGDATKERDHGQE